MKSVVLSMMAFAATFGVLCGRPASADSFVIQHDRYSDEGGFVDNDACSFPVVVWGTSNSNDALFFDSDGSLVRILSTVNHAEITFSANGKTLTAKGSGGIEYEANPDGSVTVNTFGINLLMTIPHYGVVQLDTGRATFLFDPHLNVLFHAGPASYDVEAFCAALADD